MGQQDELASVKSLYEQLNEDQKRLTMMLFEKTKAWEKEINTNDHVRAMLGP